MTNLRGLISAAYTPMTKRGVVSIRTIDRLAEMLVDNAVNGVFVNGNSGEFASLTVQERLSVARRWGAAAGPTLTVIIHVGHTCLKAARELAREAQKAQAAAIAAVPPFYFKPHDIDEAITFLASIAQAAPKLPFYYYHHPEMTGVSFPMIQFLEEARKRIPTLAGVNFCADDMTDFGRCVDAFGKDLNLLLGRDELLLGGLKMGGHGMVGASCNFAAQLCLRIIRDFKSGEMGKAQNLQVRGVELLAALRRYGQIPAGKAIMALTGCDCGPVRPPFKVITPEQFEQIQQQLERIGFDELRSR
jgi:N-acetylneuraminate lyase